MKKLNTATHKFITDNIKVNTNSYSYPIRKIAINIQTPKKVQLNKNSKNKTTEN